MKNVKGKTAVITGSAMGMGKELAKCFARDDAKLVLVDIVKEELDKTASEIRHMGADVHTFICDLSERPNIYDLAKKVRKEVGPVDIVVNNAGVVFGGEFLEVDDAKHQKCVDINLNAVMWVTKAFLPDLIEKEEGHIINMASAAGFMGVPNLAVYCATKYGVVGFTEAMRAELRDKGIKNIKFTTVCPSYVGTGMFDGARPPLLTRFISPKSMAKKIYKAMKEDQVVIIEPFMARITPLLKMILSHDAFETALKITGTSSSMKTWTGRKA